MPDAASTPESGVADRLIFFSDAVVAIAITLLALELPVPTGPTTSALWSSVRHDSSEYLAFLINAFYALLQVLVKEGWLLWIAGPLLAGRISRRRR